MTQSPAPDDIEEPNSDGDYVPPRKKPADDAGYLEVMAQAVFQAGFSWRVVRSKWPTICLAFDSFDINRVAAYDELDFERLIEDEAIIRNGRKIQAVIDNARIMQDIIAEHGSFHAYLRTMDGLPYPKRSKQLARRFKWLGRTGVYYFLWCVDEDIPDWEER